ncbi:MAG: FAD-binding oxidoreductase [Rhodospirillales bacterium]|jgi:glycine/D-amino acid oxidase-like deaminating enzyme|nr:FAD-binding oxidoreductase [Rhodospirillales bacterium]
MRRVAIIGGGVTGCSVAWHLASQNIGEIHLFERDQLGSGTTWHSAGNITWKPVDDNDAPVLYLLDLIKRLEDETNLTSGWRTTGRLFLARDTDTLDMFSGFHEGALDRGVDARMLSPREASGLHPLLEASSLSGAWLNPLAGYLNPADLVTLYARSARALGAELHEQSNVSNLTTTNGHITGIVCGDETLEFDDVIICGGLWSSPLVAEQGVTLAQGGCEHFYIILDIDPRLASSTPSFVSPSDFIYGREEVGGLLLGCFDEQANTIDISNLPDPFSFSLLNENWDKFSPYFDRAAELFPALLNAPVRRFVNGPEAFTPDGNPFIGPVSDIDGLWLCTGMNSHGVTISGASGHIIADMLADREPRFAIDLYAPGRFGTKARDEVWLEKMISDAPSSFYQNVNPKK